MNRRDFLKRIAAAGLIAATPEIIVPEKRFWQLDRTMADTDTYTTDWFDAGAEGFDKVMVPQGYLEEMYRIQLQIKKDLESKLLYGMSHSEYQGILNGTITLPGAPQSRP